MTYLVELVGGPKDGEQVYLPEPWETLEIVEPAPPAPTTREQDSAPPVKGRYTRDAVSAEYIWQGWH